MGNSNHFIFKIIEPPSVTLSKWIIQNSAGISNLKLQKLLFYCYGVASAFDLEYEIGECNFQAWKYGPVEPRAYRHFAHNGSGLINKPESVHHYSKALEEKLLTTLKIYGKLSPMCLVRQSHLESPWKDAWENDKVEIHENVIKSYFSKKFKSASIAFPEVILDSGFFEIDKIPVTKFRSLEEMAEAID